MGVCVYLRVFARVFVRVRGPRSRPLMPRAQLRVRSAACGTRGLAPLVVMFPSVESVVPREVRIHFKINQKCIEESTHAKRQL